MKWIGALFVGAWVAVVSSWIKAPQPGKEVALFNAKDLNGWVKNGGEKWVVVKMRWKDIYIEEK